MKRLFILNDAGEPVSVTDPVAWLNWYETADRKIADVWVGGNRVSSDLTICKIRVLTCFMGIDTGFSSGGFEPAPEPWLFETSVFAPHPTGVHAIYVSRYQTRAEAVRCYPLIAGAVEALRARGKALGAESIAHEIKERALARAGAASRDQWRNG